MKKVFAAFGYKYMVEDNSDSSYQRGDIMNREFRVTWSLGRTGRRFGEDSVWDMAFYESLVSTEYGGEFNIWINSSGPLFDIQQGWAVKKAEGISIPSIAYEKNS